MAAKSENKSEEDAGQQDRAGQGRAEQGRDGYGERRTKQSSDQTTSVQTRG